MRTRIAWRVGAPGEWTPRSKLSEKHCPRVALLSIDSGRATRAPFTHSILTPREGEAHVFRGATREEREKLRRTGADDEYANVRGIAGCLERPDRLSLNLVISDDVWTSVLDL